MKNFYILQLIILSASFYFIEINNSFAQQNNSNLIIKDQSRAIFRNQVQLNPINKSKNTKTIQVDCQGFTLLLNSNSQLSQQNNNTYTLETCPNDTINLMVSGVYSSNDSLYHQSDSTTAFFWNMANGITQNKYLSEPSNIISSQIITLTAIDSNACPALDTLNIHVYIAPTPNFSNTTTLIPTFCLGDTTILTGEVSPDSIILNSYFGNDSLHYLPDGSGTSYSSYINYFSPINQTLTNVNDLTITATLEHSYLGDLDISITCPNGQQATLKSYPGGGNTFLGEPIDNNPHPIPGLGYEYAWRNSGTTTMINAASTYNYTYTDVTGAYYTNHHYLPPSFAYPATSTALPPYPLVIYKPETPYTSLIGCPLNGTWQITITDNMQIDNGFLFDWGIDISSNNGLSFNQLITSSSWDPDSSIIQTNGNQISILPPDSGIFQYTYSAIDSFGCTFDTSISVHVLPIPHALFGSDTTVCGYYSITLAVDSNLVSQLWSNNSTSQVIYVDSAGIGFGTKEISVQMLASNGCTNTDSILIHFTNCSGISSTNNLLQGITIYPNPSSGNFTLSGKVNSKKAIKLQLMDISGKTILKKIISLQKQDFQYNINLNSLSRGMYFLRISDDTVSKIFKLIIK